MCVCVCVCVCVNSAEEIGNKDQDGHLFEEKKSKRPIAAGEGFCSRDGCMMCVLQMKPDQSQFLQSPCSLRSCCRTNASVSHMYLQQLHVFSLNID